MRVLVCGGRNFADAARLARTLDTIHANTPICVIIHGGARGADRLAGAWARARGLQEECYLADWENKGKAAGPLRNQRMLEEGKPDLVVAFPGAFGTRDMIARSCAAGIKIEYQIGDHNKCPLVSNK